MRLDGFDIISYTDGIRKFEQSPGNSIIVLNWNGLRYLGRCLDAIAAQTFQDYEVLVLDNNSTDGSLEDVPQRWPAFQMVRFSQNLGFAAGNNRGAELARGRWIAFLNNDAFLSRSGWLICSAQPRRIPHILFSAPGWYIADDAERVQDTGNIYHVSGLHGRADNNCPVQNAHLESDDVFSPVPRQRYMTGQLFWK